MSEETTTTPPPVATPPAAAPAAPAAPVQNPWEVLGFESFKAYDEHKDQAAASLKKQLDDSQKMIGRQGEQLGTFRKTLEEFGAKIEDGKIVRPAQEPVDYSAEAAKIESSLSQQQTAELNARINAMTPQDYQALQIKDKNQLATDPETRYRYLQGYVAAVGQPVPENVFGNHAGSTATPEKPLEARVKDFWRTAQTSSGRLPPPTGGVAPSAAGRPSAVQDPQAQAQIGRFSAPGGDLLGGIARSRGESGSPPTS